MSGAYGRADLGQAIEALNEDFGDIIDGDPVHAIPATAQERRDSDVPDLPRIALGFNRRDFGRLREMIDVLNLH